MRSVYLAALATVTLFVAVFSVINMSGEALFTKENAESLVSLPSHYRWGYGGYLSPAQYYNVRGQVGNLSGIARSELHSQDEASTSLTGLGIIDVFAVPNTSIVYSGLNYVSGARTPGPGQVIAIRNSNSSSLFIGRVIQANFTFYAGYTGGSNKYVSIVRNLTVAGFADSTVNGFGYLTNSELGSAIGNLFPFPTLVANWDDLIPPMVDFVNSNHAEPFLTQLFVYVRQSDFSNLDAKGELSKAQSLQGQIQSITSSIGGSTDSWLIDQIQQRQLPVSFQTSVALATATVALILTFPITEYLISTSVKTSQSVSSGTETTIDSTFRHRFYRRIIATASIGIVIGIIVSILTASFLVYSSATVWTPTLETLAYSVVYGIALAAVIWFQSRDTLSKQSRGASQSKNAPPSPNMLHFFQGQRRN